MLRYADYLIYIFINIMETLEIRDKITEKLIWYTNNITHISAAYCPIVAHLVSYIKSLSRLCFCTKFRSLTNANSDMNNLIGKPLLICLHYLISI